MSGGNSVSTSGCSHRRSALAVYESQVWMAALMRAVSTSENSKSWGGMESAGFHTVRSVPFTISRFSSMSLSWPASSAILSWVFRIGPSGWVHRAAELREHIAVAGAALDGDLARAVHCEQKAIRKVRSGAVHRNGDSGLSFAEITTAPLAIPAATRAVCDANVREYPFFGSLPRCKGGPERAGNRSRLLKVEP